MKKTIYLMRHGQTLFNKYERMQGWCDSPLTEKGHAQARVAGEYFKKNGITFDAVYTSTLTRTQETLHSAFGDIDFTPVAGLKEWCFGKLEGSHGAYAPKKPFGDFYIPFGGEGESDVLDRYSKAVEELANKDGDTIFILSHGGVMRLFASEHNGEGDAHFSGMVDNCMVFKYTYEDGTFTMEEIIKHDFSSIENMEDLF